MRTAVLVLLSLTTLAAQSADELLAQISKWQADTSRQPLLALSQMVQKAPPAQRRELEQKFIAFLKTDATLAAKDFICKQLSVTGSEASAPALAALLQDPKTADMGRYALERIPGAAVDRALRDGLAKSTGKTRIGIVNTLGQRRDPASVAALKAVALSAQPDEASAAVFALAQIADTAAVDALSEAHAKSSGRVRADAAEALLQAANRMVERRDSAAALPIYRKLYALEGPGSVRAAALRGLAIASDGQSNPILMEALRGSDLRLQAVAVHALVRVSSARLIDEMPKLSEAAQVRILGLLSERADAAALPAFAAALKSTSNPVRLAAVRGIGTVGDAGYVSTLAALAAGADPGEQAAARASLAQLRGMMADQAIADAIGNAPPKVKRELIRAAGERGAANAAPILLGAARDADSDVRRESLRALAGIGSAAQIAGVVQIVVSPVQPDDRTEAVRTLSALLRRAEPFRIQDALAHANAADVEVRAAFLRAVGPTGNPQALGPLRTALKDPDAGVKRAAILALTEWPDPAPVADLLETARTSTDASHQTLAVRGAIQLIGLSAPARPHAESARLVADAMSLARQAAEKRAILALLPRYPVKETLDLATALANDPEVGLEAKAAAARLERTVRR